MQDLEGVCRDVDGATTLRVRGVPRAAHEEIVGVHPAGCAARLAG